MSTHNICFCGEIRKISVLFGCTKCLIQEIKKKEDKNSVIKPKKIR